MNGSMLATQQQQQQQQKQQQQQQPQPPSQQQQQPNCPTSTSSSESSLVPLMGSVDSVTSLSVVQANNNVTKTHTAHHHQQHHQAKQPQQHQHQHQPQQQQQQAQQPQPQQQQQACPASSGSPTASAQQPTMCRDFLRNVCTRGAKCRFSHGQTPNQEEKPKDNKDCFLTAFSKSVSVSSNSHTSISANSVAPSNPRKVLQDAVVFCHDFQNSASECSRPNCRFIHCCREEEVEFRRSGYLPPHLRDQVIKKGIAPDLPALFGERPVCKDFLKGECKWTACRFRHLSKKQFDLEINHHIVGRHHVSSFQSQNNYVSFDHGLLSSSHTAKGSLMWSGGAMGKKRRRQDDDLPSTNPVEEGKTEVEVLRHENLQLKQKVEELRKQVQDLTTTNDFLLDQNAQLRMGVKHHQQPAHPQPNTTNVVNAAPPTQISVPLQPSITMTATMPPPTISMAAAMQAAPATISMSGAAPMSAPVPQPPSISITAPVPPPQAPGPPPQAASVSMPGHTMATVPVPTISCHAAITGQQAPPATVHVQESRLVTYPITSIRQPM